MKSKIEYPDISFWDTSARVIEFINPGEFRVDEHLEMIGLHNHPLRSTFGCVDRTEIIRRQKNIRFLVEHPTLGATISGLSRVSQLPIDSVDFMRSFTTAGSGPHHELWNLIDQFCSQIGRIRDAGTEIPPDIALLDQFLRDMALPFKRREEEMSRTVATRLSKAVAFGGIIKYTVNTADFCLPADSLSQDHDDAFGFRPFSLKPAPIMPTRPQYESMSKFRQFFEKKYFALEKLLYLWRVRRWAKPLIVHHLPDIVAETISNFVRKTFCSGSVFSKGYRARFSKELTSQELTTSVMLTIAYRLDDSGLSLSLLSIKPQFDLDIRAKSSYTFEPLRVEGTWVSQAFHEKVWGINHSSATRSCAIWHDSIALNDTLELVKEHAPDLLGKGIKLDVPEIFPVLSWNAATGVIGLDKGLLEVLEEAQSLRSYVRARFHDLSNVADISSKFVTLGRRFAMPLHYPEIMQDSEHLFSFGEVMPIHLIGRPTTKRGKSIKASDLKPICSLVPLKGNMIGLTGQNMGGKTVTQEALLFTVFDAQSGFPIIGGQEIRLNVKNTIGMVFMERGEGSTVELMLRKTGPVIETALKHPKNGTLVVLDELGSGTQESKGAIIGERILAKLHESGCSVVFSTQIAKLARAAEEKFGAKCFAFDIQHRIRDGIGEGNPELIAEELGLDKLLGMTKN